MCDACFQLGTGPLLHKVPITDFGLKQERPKPPKPRPEDPVPQNPATARKADMVVAVVSGKHARVPSAGGTLELFWS